MPTYTYRCKDCGEQLEVVRSFSDDPLTVCPSCDGTLRQVFKPAGIVFKGSGWHIKDYAGNGSGGAGGDAASSSTSSGDSSSSASSSSSSDAGSSSTASSSSSTSSAGD